MQGSVEPIIQRLLRWPGLITLGTQFFFFFFFFFLPKWPVIFYFYFFYFYFSTQYT